MKNYNYSERVDKALGNSYSPHRTLRSCLDPGSSEWNETNMDERVEVLKKLVKAGDDLDKIFLAYKITYNEMNKPHVSKNLENGLTALLQHILNKQS